MRYTPSAFPLLLASLALGSLSAADITMSVDPVKVGRNLQAQATVKFSGPVPGHGIQLTLTSDDPKKIRLSRRPDVDGTSSVIVPVGGAYRESPEFWVHGLGPEGEATFTVSAPDMKPAQAKVMITPSAVLLVGPYKASAFKTQPASTPSRLVLYTGRLEPNGDFAEQQLLSANAKLDVELKNSDDKVGTISKTKLSWPGGEPNLTVDFTPGKEAGKTVVTLASLPAGFSKAPEQYAAINAEVVLPGISITTQIYIGENLQSGGSLGLGAYAPAEGLEVTLESSDPTKLLLSNSASEPGKPKIVVKIKGGDVNGSYFMQSLSRAGKVTYRASAKGYTTREAVVGLAPSGVTIAPSAYGPPDEAELLRRTPEEARGFVAHLSDKNNKMPLAIWTHHLDPETMRSADVTVQPLRAGYELQIPVTLQDPKVGKLSTSMAVIKGGKEMTSLDFTPLAAGASHIVISTPKGMAGSANSTKVPFIVKD